MSDNNNGAASPGWYPAEDAPGFERYWDGAAWRMDQIRPIGPVSPPTSVIPIQTATEQGPLPWYKRKAIIIPGSIVAGLIVIGAIGSASAGDKPEEPTVEVTPWNGGEEVKEPVAEVVTVDVPEVEGMSVADATAAIEDAGLVAEVEGPSDEKGAVVIAQAPISGVEAEEGATVTVTVEVPEPEMTLAQENAYNKGLDYLAFMAFSREGLAEQLEYEGFEAADIEFGIAKIESDKLVSWKEQAAQKAQDYLDMMSFSREGLAEQLDYEGFTKGQIDYALKEVGF